MRSAEGSEAKPDCEDPMIKAACLIEDDSCPAECKEGAKEDKDEPTVVKAGDLAVTAKAAEGKKALIGGTSDLDTLTFKTSEEVTISSITLERYGYSTIDDVDTVQLEDEDGNIIADAKELNSKGQVKLTIKKDYRKVDGTYKATVVLVTNDLSDVEGKKNGSTIGFKVVSAESTAKNLNLDDYDPYTYDLVNYDGSKVQFSDRNSNEKTYSWEAGKLYEVAKFRVKAPADSAILVKGFTLTDEDTTDNWIEADKFAQDVEVTVNGEKVKGLKWNFNKSDELVISFDEVEIAGKETATIVVNMSLNEEFDNIGAWSMYYIEDLTKFNAVDKKTGTRVSQDPEKKIEDINWTAYQFKWGKIKIAWTKLWTINAAAGASNVKIAEWEITLTEAVRWSAEIVLKDAENFAKVDEMRLVIGGEEYDGTKDATNHKFKFSGLEIEKSGKVEVRLDIKDDQEGNIEFDGSLNSASFNLKYDESGEDVDADRIVGSLSISTVKIQAAKASLDNKNTKDVELIVNENNRKTIFEGTYAAKKGAVTMKNFVITTIEDDLALVPGNPTFYVTIDGEEYDAQWSVDEARWDIDDIEVADWKSVSVKVEIELTPTTADVYNTFNIAFEWEDEDNNPAGNANEDTAKVKVVDQGSLDVNSSAKNTVLLKSNREVAKFTIKPSKAGDDDVLLNEMVFSAKKDGTAVSAADFATMFKIDIDGDDYAGTEIAPGTRVPTEWLVVTVTLKKETPAEIEFTLASINWSPDVKTTFKKYFVSALLKITQRKTADMTYYSVDVEKDGSEVVKNVRLLKGTCDDAAAAAAATDSSACKLLAASTEDEALSNSNEDLMKAENDTKAQTITYVYYEVGDEPVFIPQSVYGDFFKKANGSDDLMVYSNGNN